MGRPRKPIGLEMVERTSKRSLRNVLQLPKPERAPRCPKRLQHGYARELWHQLAPEMTRLGLLNGLFSPLFECLCWSYGLFKQASEDVDAYGMVYDHRGMTRIRPQVRIAWGAFEQFLRVALEFGMTPNSRQRIRVTKPKMEPLSKLASDRAKENRRKWDK